METNKSVLQNGISTDVYVRNGTETSLMNDHFHKYHELYFLLEGNAKYFIENEIVNVKSGQGVFIKKGNIHKATYDYGKSSKRILICFTSDFIGEEYFSLLTRLDNNKFFSPTSVTQKEIERLFFQILSENSDQKEFYLPQCKNLLRELTVLLSREKTGSSPTVLNENERIIQEAAEYISNHLEEDLSLKDLASRHAMSESHFSRTFSHCTGIGVSRYIKFKRLQKAEALLNLNRYTVAEIAIRCGFNHSNYFIREFKQYKGITPFQYAAKNQKR